MKLFNIISIITALVLSTNVNATFINETDVAPDFSADFNVTTPIGTLGVGVTSVVGDIGWVGDRRDIFTFEVADGTALKSVTIHYSTSVAYSYSTFELHRGDHATFDLVEFINLNEFNSGIDLLQFDSAPGQQPSGFYTMDVIESNNEFSNYQIDFEVVPSVPALLGSITFDKGLNSDSCVEAINSNGTLITLSGHSSLEGTSFVWLTNTGEIVQGSELTLMVGLGEIEEVNLQLTALDGRTAIVSKSVCVTDTTPPSIVIISPIEGEVFTGNNMVLEVNILDAVDKNINSYGVHVGSSFSTGLFEGYSRVQIFKPEADKMTAITVEASDSSGNTATATVNVLNVHDTGE